jgi:hypothetical protein
MYSVLRTGVVRADASLNENTVNPLSFDIIVSTFGDLGGPHVEHGPNGRDSSVARRGLKQIDLCQLKVQHH